MLSSDMSCIYGIGENGGNSSVTPVIYVHIGAEMRSIGIIEIFSCYGGRLRDFLGTKGSGNSMYAVSVKVKLINLANNGGAPFINNKVIFILRIFDISVRSFIPYVLALTLTGIKCRLYLFGDVLRIHIIKQISERSNVKGGSVEGINVIVEGDVANTVFGEIHFHIEVALKVISSKS